MRAFRFLPAILGLAFVGGVPLAGVAAPVAPDAASGAGIRPGPSAPFTVLAPGAFAHYVEHFNTTEPETIVNVVPNAQAWDWMVANIPLFSCPDPGVEEMYYFRWWSFRKHLIRTPSGYAFTEFLQRPDPISSAIGHHVMEGRWLRDPVYIDDYARYWLRGGPNGTLHPKLHNYSDWLAYALYERYLVLDDTGFVTAELDDLIRDYRQWETERQLPGGLFWQYDVRDAMEESISGSRYLKNIRPPLNSYMYGNARAIAAIARLAGREDVARTYDAKAAKLRALVESSLWDPAAKFFKVRLEVPVSEQSAYEKLAARRHQVERSAQARHAPPPPPLAPPPGPYDTTLSDTREEIGFTPWYFNLPEPGHGYEDAWLQFDDDAGFHAPWGITTAERRAPRFRSHGTGHCEWDGAVWPFATSQTLTALANVLHDYPQRVVDAHDWFDAFVTYSRSQHQDGKPYIGEYLDEKTGDWIKVHHPERSRYYNHSTFADLVINDLVGLRPRGDNLVAVAPLLPANSWDWFCADGISYHGHLLTIIWDRTGDHFHRGAGLTVLADGKPIAHGATLAPVTGPLPASPRSPLQP
ncbi:MAG TPA: glycosyl hydrolase family 65 protein [Opitutaceae bacterium]|nr:glycosyl hydrolase family 65 protein [Opitutaceae bacterium]